ncbi:MAG TPA: LytTR family DNA-binding domain-containing protein [Longimicrobium sp.]|nr:LytTR family DNA-binding domain-containing protein [Longimicrobium sp.]
MAEGAMPSRPVRVLIADDEPLARRRIRDLLAHAPGAEVAGEAEDGDAAVRAIRSLRPDLVFLDVQMPGRTGLEVVREIGAEAMPATIFVTAYDQHALAAFEVAAVDYLVKPFDDERFEQAFRRARRRIELQEVGRLSGELLALLQGAAPAPPAFAPPAAPAYLERIAVEMRGQVRVVPVGEIDYVVAAGPYAELHAGEKTYVIRERMQTLEERLDPALFFRTHRSIIVRLERVEALLRAPGGDYAVRLRGGARLKVSRGRFEELEARMGVPHRP